MVYPVTDWQDMLFKKFAVNERLNVSLSGGGKTARYYVSGAFNQDNGVLKVNGRNNFNNNINLKNFDLRSNIDLDLNPTTKLTVRMHGNFDDYNGPLGYGADYYRQVLRTNPVMFPAVYEPDEANLLAKHILFGNVEDGSYSNPYADLVKRLQTIFYVEDFGTVGIETEFRFYYQRTGGPDHVQYRPQGSF